MNLNNHTYDVLAPRDIRRYPSEIDRVPSRDTGHGAEAGRSVTFLQVASGVDSANGANGADSASAAPTEAKIDKPFSLWEKDGFGFGDLIDIINPLHHIPIVATIYRNLSGDQIGAAPRVVGGAVWGRIGGLVAGVVNAVVEWWSGKDIGDHIYAAVFGDPKKLDGATAVAQNRPPTAGAAPSSLAARKEPAPQSDDIAAAAAVEPPHAAVPENAAVGPAALLSEPPPTRAPAARAALNSYKKNLNRGYLEESRRIRLPV
jgi:hypothetical protein